MSKKPKFTFTLVGKTENDKPVVAGLFNIFQTYGFPLDYVIEYFENKGWEISTLDLACEMYIAGVKPSTIPNRVASLFEMKSPEWKETVLTRLSKLIPQE